MIGRYRVPSGRRRQAFRRVASHPGRDIVTWERTTADFWRHPMRTAILLSVLSVISWLGASTLAGADDPPGAWRPLPLVKDGKVDPAWVHVGYGGFAVEDGALRTECDEKG